MKLQIYAEDTHCDAFRILAEKAVYHWYKQKGGIPLIGILATPMLVSEIYKNMPSLVSQAKRDKCGCVAFVVDREGPSSRHHRPQELQRIENAFSKLCQEPPDQIKIMLIIVDICLESWLLADPDGLVKFVVQRKGKNSNYSPLKRRTDLDGQDSQNHAHRITEIFQTVEKKLGVRHPRTKYDKADSDRIAEYIDPVYGREWNDSLGYFCEMVPCKKDGCQHRQE